jgi:hypothetical protein
VHSASEIHIGDLVVNSDPSVIGEVMATSASENGLRGRSHHRRPNWTLRQRQLANGALRLAQLDTGAMTKPAWLAPGTSGLRPVASDRFDENRAGLDQLAFRVANKDELHSAAAYLDELNIGHEPIKDIGPGYILEFCDPDNIALELSAPK